MPELVGEERIAALEAENARLRAALEEAQINFQLQQKLINIPRLAEAERKVDAVLSGDDSALKARLEAARDEGRQAAEANIYSEPNLELCRERDSLRAQLAERDKRIAADEEDSDAMAEAVSRALGHDNWALVEGVRLVCAQLTEVLHETQKHQRVFAQLEERAARAETERDAWRRHAKFIEAEQGAKIASLQRRIADNLCYLKPGEALDPMLPKDQHMESCSRFYDQEVGKRGVVAGCMTIAQLEKALAQSEDLFKEAEKSWSALARNFRDERDQLVAQVERLRGVADDVVQGGGIADLEDARAVLAETPAASLAAVREQARREALEEAMALFPNTPGVAELWTPQQIRTMLRELAAQPAKEPQS